MQSDRVMQIVEVSAGIFGGWVVVVRWRWETGETGKDVYELDQEAELAQLLEDLGITKGTV